MTGGWYSLCVSISVLFSSTRFDTKNLLIFNRRFYSFLYSFFYLKLIIVSTEPQDTCPTGTNQLDISVCIKNSITHIWGIKKKNGSKAVSVVITTILFLKVYQTRYQFLFGFLIFTLTYVIYVLYLYKIDSRLNLFMILTF